MKLKNLPIPEAHIFGIVLGVLIHLLFKVNTFNSTWTGHLVGWPLIVPGTVLSIWAAIEAGEIDISSPQELVTSGPYTYSRNPMYVGWSLIYLGIAFVMNSLWLIVLFPLVMIYIHFIDIPKEERFLERTFGSQFSEYRKHVRKYL
jgi:protein-S-isoprenylcysteine O-methyltransferase Ste14